jgi:hypothetical protein
MEDSCETDLEELYATRDAVLSNIFLNALDNRLCEFVQSGI